MTTMASLPKTPAVAERADLHKSCKFVETLLNILSEYCEAAAIVLSLQKKLAKALKDVATSKATAEIACMFLLAFVVSEHSPCDVIANALLASANVFDNLSEVDAKFSKTLDKEYDTIGDEVKRSFKKLNVRRYHISLAEYSCTIIRRKRRPTTKRCWLQTQNLNKLVRLPTWISLVLSSQPYTRASLREESQEKGCRCKRRTCSIH